MGLKGVCPSLSYLPCLVYRATPDLVIGGGFDLDGLLNEAIEEEASSTRRPSVEAEGEFIEVIVQVFLADRTVVRSQPPPLEEGSDPVHPGHGNMGGQTGTA